MHFKIFFTKIMLSCMFLHVGAYREHYEMAEISNEDLDHIPKIFSKNLSFLKIINCNLVSLENLSMYKNLKALVIKDSVIYLLNETFFEIKLLNHLQKLSLEGSSITSFDISKLSQNSNIKDLNLSNNPGIDIYGSAIWSKITHLNIAHNNLTEVPGNIKQMRYLEELILDGNRLTEIPEYLRKLTNLHISSDFEDDLPKQEISHDALMSAEIMILEVIAIGIIIVLFALITCVKCLKLGKGEEKYENSDEEMETFKVQIIPMTVEVEN